MCEQSRHSLLQCTSARSTHAEAIMNGQAKQSHDLCGLCVANRSMDSMSAAEAVQNIYLGQANGKDSLLICKGCFSETLSLMQFILNMFQGSCALQGNDDYQLQLLSYLRMMATQICMWPLQESDDDSEEEGPAAAPELFENDGNTDL